MNVDLVAVTLICTFVVMVATAAIALLSQRPPREWQTIVCPEDQSAAVVGVSWERTLRRMVVTECNHGQWTRESCQKSCHACLQNAVRDLTPITVLP